MTNLIYKCRMCGEQFAVRRAMDFGYLAASMGGNMCIAHACSPQTNGVAELVGERADARQENTNA